MYLRRVYYPVPDDFFCFSPGARDPSRCFSAIEPSLPASPILQFVTTPGNVARRRLRMGCGLSGDGESCSCPPLETYTTNGFLVVWPGNRARIARTDMGYPDSISLNAENVVSVVRSSANQIMSAAKSHTPERSHVITMHNYLELGTTIQPKRLLSSEIMDSECRALEATAASKSYPELIQGWSDLARDRNAETALCDSRYEDLVMEVLGLERTSLEPYLGQVDEWLLPMGSLLRWHIVANFAEVPYEFLLELFPRALLSARLIAADLARTGDLSGAGSFLVLLQKHADLFFMTSFLDYVPWVEGLDQGIVLFRAAHSKRTQELVSYLLEVNPRKQRSFAECIQEFASEGPEQRIAMLVSLREIVPWLRLADE